MRFLLLQLCLLISTCIYSHNSYFSFAEMQYNQQSSCLEISICVSTHDLDFYFRQKVQDIRLEKAMENDSLLKKINLLITNGFSIKQGGVTNQLSIEAYENTLDGYTFFYLKSEPIRWNEPTSVTYDLFMDLFTEQQQKLTVLGSKHSDTYPFMLFQREQTIKLN